MLHRGLHSQQSQGDLGADLLQGCEVASAGCWASQTPTSSCHFAGPDPAEALEVRGSSGPGADPKVDPCLCPRFPLSPSEG